MFLLLDYIFSALLSMMLLVDVFHQEFTVHKLGLGPHPNLGRECVNIKAKKQKFRTEEAGVCGLLL